MRKALISFVFVSLMIGALVSNAHALSITLTDVWDPDDFKISTKWCCYDSYTFVHNIIDEGFNPVTDTVTSAKITLDVRDDGDRDRNRWGWPNIFGGLEKFDLYLDSVKTGTYEVDYSDIVRPVTLSYLDDGILNVRLDPRGWYGSDFYFRASSLQVDIDRTSAVPEPASMLLLGSGLLGLIGYRRRKL